MFRTQVFLLAAIVAGLAQAQTKSPKWMPVPYKWFWCKNYLTIQDIAKME